eukprot:m.33104 g.33104  ORF g.33104 m.33104 type:complete len:395 (-) comp4977_c0_seq1:101-1285(-)
MGNEGSRPSDSASSSQRPNNITTDTELVHVEVATTSRRYIRVSVTATGSSSSTATPGMTTHADPEVAGTVEPAMGTPAPAHAATSSTTQAHSDVNTTSAAPTALLICLHGRGGSGEQLRKGVGHQLETRDKLVVVYPDGIDRGWCDGRMGTSQAGSTTDVDFLSDIVHRERSRHPTLIRVGVCGMSNGAMMTFALMRERHRIPFDCYAPVCGLLPVWPDGVELQSRPAVTASAPTASPHAAAAAATASEALPSVVLMVGRQDKFVPICGGAVARAMRSDASLQGAPLRPWEARREKVKAASHGKVKSLEETVTALEAWLDVRVCERVRLPAEQVYTAWARASDDGRLRVIDVEECGHHWPGTVGVSKWLPLTGKVATFSGGHVILDALMGPASS